MDTVLQCDLPHPSGHTVGRPGPRFEPGPGDPAVSLIRGVIVSGVIEIAE